MVVDTGLNLILGVAIEGLNDAGSLRELQIKAGLRAVVVLEPQAIGERLRSSNRAHLPVGLSRNREIALKLCDKPIPPILGEQGIRLVEVILIRVIGIKGG